MRVEKFLHELEKYEIEFNEFSFNSAKKFLKNSNHYGKFSSYLANFERVDGKYVDLDFGTVRDLSIIDLYLKHWIVKTSLDVEHSTKVNILSFLDERGIDEHELVDSFFSENDWVLPRIFHRKTNPYIKRLIEAFHPDYPAWVFFEVASFGELVQTYEHFCEMYSVEGFDVEMLYNVRNIRNAAAHNDIIIYDLKNREGFYEDAVVDCLLDLDLSFSKSELRDFLRNEAVQDFVSLLLAVHLLVRSDSLRKNRLLELHEFFEGRVVEKKELYKSQTTILKTYNFFKEIIDTLAELNDVF